MNPADIFTPGVAVKLAAGINGDAAAIRGGKVDPADIFRPGIAAERVAAAVDAVVRWAGLVLA